MKTIVLCHIGNSWPSHINDCINNLIGWFKGTIYIIVDKENIEKVNKNIIAIDRGTLDSSHLREFNNVDIFSIYGTNGFWRYAFERLLLIEAFLIKNNIEEVIHIENDVLIYYDPDKVDFRRFYKDRVAFNPLGDIYCTASHIYIDSPSAISSVNDSLIRLLRLGTQKLLGMLPGAPMINEMMLLSILLKDNKITYLPINIIGNFSDNFNDFKMIFDPASWGQYVGGTPQGHLPGELFDHHWIGSDMRNENFSIRWSEVESGRRYPELMLGDNIYKFANLHIHSKKLIDYC